MYVDLLFTPRYVWRQVVCASFAVCTGLAMPESLLIYSGVVFGVGHVTSH